MDAAFLPSVNAALNAVATGLLVAGRVQIGRGRERAHRQCMVGAFGVSALFLVLYVVHKASRGFESITYQAEGLARTFYLAILFSHLTLAMAVPVLAIAMIRLGLLERRDAHRRLARIAWPVWMYVSVTGVVIYVMLYHLNPSG